MIYLASPYTHADPAVMQQRYEIACKAAADLMLLGFNVFSPIAHSHGLVSERAELGHKWEHWAAHDIWFIERCDSLAVLVMDGTEDSRGVAAEIEIAANRQKPIVYLHPLSQHLWKQQINFVRSIVPHGTDHEPCEGVVETPLRIIPDRPGWWLGIKRAGRSTADGMAPECECWWVTHVNDKGLHFSLGMDDPELNWMPVHRYTGEWLRRLDGSEWERK